MLYRDNLVVYSHPDQRVVIIICLASKAEALDPKTPSHYAKYVRKLPRSMNVHSASLSHPLHDTLT